MKGVPAKSIADTVGSEAYPQPSKIIRSVFWAIKSFLQRYNFTPVLPIDRNQLKWE